MTFESGFKSLLHNSYSQRKFAKRGDLKREGRPTKISKINKREGRLFGTGE